MSSGLGRGLTYRSRHSEHRTVEKPRSTPQKTYSSVLQFAQTVSDTFDVLAIGSFLPGPKRPTRRENAFHRSRLLQQTAAWHSLSGLSRPSRHQTISDGECSHI